MPNILTTELVVSDEVAATKTYKLSSDKIQGFADGLAALEQAIYKELSTEKYEHPIYSFDYAIEMENLIGKSRDYVKAELKRRITECLLKDNRIESIDKFTFSFSGDQMLCTFDVVSIYGNLTITIQKEVAA